MKGGIQPELLRSQIRLALKYIDLWSAAAEELVIFTAAAESDLVYVNQLGGGPAKSFFQIEPKTERDIFENYLNYKSRVELKRKVLDLKNMMPGCDDFLRDNIPYAAALVRLHYRRKLPPLPEPHDVVGMSMYHKKYFNTELGKARPEESIRKYHMYVKEKDYEI